MKNFRSSVSLCLLFFSCCFLSCSVGTDPGECESLECLPAQYNLHLTLETEEEYDFSFRMGRAVASFLRPGNDVSFYSGPNDNSIGLGPGSDVRLPGEVVINDYLLPPVPTTDVPVYFQTLHDTLLAPPGAYNVWRIGGAGDLPPLVDSIMTPVGNARLVFPTPFDTLSIGRGFELRFEGNITAEAPVEVLFYQSDWNGTVGRYQTTHALPTSLAITPDILRNNGFRPGIFTIELRQQYSQRRCIAPDIRSNLSFSFEYSVTLWIIE